MRNYSGSSHSHALHQLRLQFFRRTKIGRQNKARIERLLTTSAMVWFSFFISFHPTLFCRLSVVWIDSCTGSTNKPIKPDNQKTTQSINQLSKNSGCLVIYCPKKWHRYGHKVDSLSYHSGSKAYLRLYCSIVKFRAVFSQVNRWVTK